MVDLTNNPLVSVIIPNYNGVNFLEPCLKSVLDADYPNLEVIFIDNASSDASLELVRQKFSSDSRLKIIVNEIGLGPAKARNIGLRNSRGEYIAFIDNDTEVDKDWLRELVLVFEADKTIGAAQAKLLLSDRETIDSCGHFLSIAGFPYEIGAGEKDSGQYDKQRDIFGAKSAAMFIRADVLKKTGWFDEDYFMHSEETDLCWRVWLNDYRVVYVPQAVVYHKRGGSLNEYSRYLIFYEGSKNCSKTLIKNLGLKKLLLIFPLHLLGWIVICISLFFRGRFNDAKAVMRGLFWVSVNYKHILKDRKAVQAQRLAGDSKIMPAIMGSSDVFGLIKKGVRWAVRTLGE